MTFSTKPRKPNNMRQKSLALGLIIGGLCCALTVRAQQLPSFADLVEKLQPAVVNVSTTSLAENNDDFLEQNPHLLPEERFLFSENPQHISLGSGFIIRENGFIITNRHVIKDAHEINITLNDKRHYTAKIIGSDAKTDIALLKIDVKDKLPTTHFGDSDKMRVGDWVLAIGSPFGLGGSVSAGIISAKSRDIEAGPYDDFLQTDASINQGSSGGPMFNLNGEVIGINTAIFSTTGTNMGIGFAMPVNTVKFVINQLLEKGKVERGWIGIKIQPYEGSNNSAAHGVIISDVMVGSGAAKAGIEAGDIILSVNNKIMEDTKELSRTIAELAIGQKVKLKIKRGEIEIDKIVTIEKMPEDKEKAPRIKATLPTDNSNFNELGLRLEELPADDKQTASADRGVIISEVKSGSDAENKGLKKGSIITQIDKKTVFDLNDVRTYIADARAENHRPVLLLIEDNNVPHFVAVKLEKDDQS